MNSNTFSTGEKGRKVSFLTTKMVVLGILGYPQIKTTWNRTYNVEGNWPRWTKNAGWINFASKCFVQDIKKCVLGS